jgi:glycosyltransferase involved in cell wall biosynthesis
MVQLNVLISAYACRPGEGSEPGIGWDVARELAKYHNVWVLTRENNRSPIAAELDRNPVPGLQVIHVDLPTWARWWKRGMRGVQLHYYLWQIIAYFVARDLHRDLNFDLVHHVTYVRYWGPSFLSLLPVPFIWGPVGGGESAPQAFRQDFGWRGKLYERIRDMAHWLGEHDPFVHMTAQRSVLVRATTEDTAKRLYHLGAKTVQVYSQVGLSEAQIDELAKYAEGDRPPIRFISIGRLLHWKGFHLGLHAFAKADLPEDAEYWVVGDGPERQRLQALAETLNISSRVKFWGLLPRQETLNKLGECFVLVHPSLHESGGLVCVEAMATGRPVICLDLGGPAVQVTAETGFKIPAHNPEQVIEDLNQAMTCLAKDPDVWLRLSQGAQIRVREQFSWKAKGLDLNRTYENILSQVRSCSTTMI